MKTYREQLKENKCFIFHVSLFFAFVMGLVRGQTYPSFGPEINVTINGLTFDAMEPFISPDGNFLFFNNLNDGINTKLFYAIKVNDSTFNLVGEINGTNQSVSPHLDAVADLDTLNNFYWTSTRNYPAQFETLFHGTFNNGTVSNIGPVFGNFNKNLPGWIVMDHGITYDGQLLYYNNARLDGNNCPGPCETEIGIAVKVNDSIFSKLPNSDMILQNINDTNYIYYAPCISSDNLELYYTRYLKANVTPSTLAEICVAVRNSPTVPFSAPKVLFSEPILNIVEAPTLTANKQIMYYHKKILNSYKIMMRYRNGPVTAITLHKQELFKIYPNVSCNKIKIIADKKYQNFNISIYSALGKNIMTLTNQTEININALPAGVYFLKLETEENSEMKKFIKIE